MLWLKIRLGLVVFATVTGLLYPATPPEDIQWMDVLVVAAISPVMVLVVAGVQAINPASDRVWTSPSWLANPFDMGQPLQAAHLAATFFVGTGIGMSAAYSWRSSSLVEPSMISAFGLGIWAGVWLSYGAFANKRRAP